MQKHFQSLRKFDIINDVAFMLSNEMFKSVMTLLKRSGKANVQHKDVITESDMTKLYTSKTLDIATAHGLQYNVFIDFMFYTCRGSRENLRKMSKADFQLKHDSQGRRYYQNVAKYETKKSQG